MSLWRECELPVTPSPTLIDENTDSQPVVLSFEKVMSDSLGRRYAIDKVLPLVALLLIRMGDREGWMIQEERKRKQ